MGTPLFAPEVAAKRDIRAVDGLPQSVSRRFGAGRRLLGVRAEQHVVQEGSSPSGAQMRGPISKSGGNSSLAEESRRYADV
jgi:hypothetical protein